MPGLLGVPSLRKAAWWSLVAHGVATGMDLAEMDLATLQGFCPDIKEDVYQVLTLEGSVGARDHLGGTAPRQVAAAAERALALLEQR